jgi:predicted O-methyltransferase YrrM
VYNYLNETIRVPEGLRRNRSVREGYQRGAGLETGNLRERIRVDPLYREALEASNGRSVMKLDRRFNIFLLLKFFLPRIPSGHIIEFGSFRGGNVLFMAYVAAQLYPGVKVYALDTFDGMPETDASLDLHRAGDFTDTDLEGFRSCINELGLDNIEIRQGLFEDTAKQALEEAGQIALAHIDCDIHSAVAYSYDAVRDYMVEGGYYVFDDATSATCIGATEVIEDLLIRRDGLSSEQIFPHFVFRHFSEDPAEPPTKPPTKPPTTASDSS